MRVPSFTGLFKNSYYFWNPATFRKPSAGS
jgi:hypothetical protein